MTDPVLLRQDDPRFPKAVLLVQPQPEALWAEGDLSLLERPIVAIVGSRHPSPYGIRVAYDIARGLSEAGVVVVSGLAKGLDARAHRGALDGGTGTIAVLGTGLDVPYPAENVALKAEIRERGLLLSEFPAGTPPLPFRFPQRNRIVVALGRCLLVVEGKVQGGTSNSVWWAQQVPRNIFAVPGRVGDDLAEGPNLLLHEGAALCLGAEDILEFIGVHARRRPPGPTVADATAEARARLTGAEATLFDLIGPHPVHVDLLAERSALAPGLLLAALSALELQGLVTQLPGKHFVLAA